MACLVGGEERNWWMGVAYIFLTTVRLKEDDGCFLHIDMQAILQPSPRESELVKVSYTLI
jgi:hypothetical protein